MQTVDKVYAGALAVVVGLGGWVAVKRHETNKLIRLNENRNKLVKLGWRERIPDNASLGYSGLTFFDLQHMQVESPKQTEAWIAVHHFEDIKDLEDLQEWVDRGIESLERGIYRLMMFNDGEAVLWLEGDSAVRTPNYPKQGISEDRFGPAARRDNPGDKAQYPTSESLHKRAAEVLGWTVEQTQQFSLPSLRDLVRSKNSKLAYEITQYMGSADSYRR